MKTITATSARANFFGLIDETAEAHEPILITAKRNNAVLISEEDWRSMEETLYLTSIPGFVESILEASNTPDDEWISHEEIMRALQDEDRPL